MLELLANGLVADPRITSPSARFDSRRDASLPGAPWVSATVGFSWRLSLGERLDLLIDGGPFYVGASRLTFGGRQHYRMGDYATGRLAFGVGTAGWTAIVFVDTLFDTEANTLAYSDPFRLSDTQSITSLRPRTIGLKLKWAP